MTGDTSISGSSGGGSGGSSGGSSGAGSGSRGSSGSGGGAARANSATTAAIAAAAGGGGGGARVLPKWRVYQSVYDFNNCAQRLSPVIPLCLPLSHSTFLHLPQGGSMSDRWRER